MIDSAQFRLLFPYIVRQWPTLLLILAITLAASAVTALQPWPVKILVDYALGEMPLPEPVAALLQALFGTIGPQILIVIAALASLVLFALNAALEGGLTWSWSAAGQRMVYDLTAELFHRLQRLSLLFHSRRTVGDALSRLSGDSYCVYSFANGLLISPAQRLLTLVAISTVAWHLDPLLTAVALGMAPLMAASALFFGRHLKQRAKRNRAVQSRLASFVHQTLTAIPLVQAFGTEGRNRRYFQSLAEDAVALSQRGNLLMSAYNLMNGLSTSIGTALILYLGGQRVLTGALTVGSLLVFIAYLQSMQKAFKGLLSIYGNLKTAEANLDRVDEILSSRERIEEAVGAEELPARGGGEVRFEGVTFGYEADCTVLREVSLEVRAGQTVALVGPTGAGKSTLVGLLPRFFDPWSGRVLVDGMDVRRVKLASLRSRIALVLQEPFLLPLTVAENIAYGRPGASREAVEAAAVAANAEEFIRRLPQGYETVLGERGSTLSGGQRQRLAIARALLKDAPVLILDEPTAALDAQTEALLLEALERLMAGRTTLIIAHRLSTIRRADRIVFLDQGRVVESGTHQELMTRQGHYWRFYRLQHGDRPLRRSVA